MIIIESEIQEGSGLTILPEKGSGGCGKRLNLNCAPRDEDNGGGERAEGGVGTWWRGAMEGKKMRNICNNLNKDLFKK